MRYELSGTVMQTLAIDLDPGEVVFSQSNCMCWMNDCIQMDTHTGGGFLAGLKRSFSGGTLFHHGFRRAGRRACRLRTAFPRGTIKPVLLGAGQSLICPQGDVPLRGKVGDPRLSPGPSASVPASSAARASSSSA